MVILTGKEADHKQTEGRPRLFLWEVQARKLLVRFLRERKEEEGEAVEMETNRPIDPSARRFFYCCQDQNRNAQANVAFGHGLHITERVVDDDGWI